MTGTQVRSEMICPRCGIPMNHHCDKAIYAPDADPIAGTERSVGGDVIQEFHACPRCGGQGRGAARLA
jgi:ribosomal protein S27AE